MNLWDHIVLWAVIIVCAPVGLAYMLRGVVRTFVERVGWGRIGLSLAIVAAIALAVAGVGCAGPEFTAASIAAPSDAAAVPEAAAAYDAAIDVDPSALDGGDVAVGGSAPDAAAESEGDSNTADAAGDAPDENSDGSACTHVVTNWGGGPPATIPIQFGLIEQGSRSVLATPPACATCESYGCNCITATAYPQSQCGSPCGCSFTLAGCNMTSDGLAVLSCD